MTSETAEDIVLEAPGLVVRLDARGTVVSVAPSAAPRTPWLVHAGALSVRIDGAPLALGLPEVAVDADEVEVERRDAGLRSVVRHASGDAWSLRVLLVDEARTGFALSHVRLGWRPAPGQVVTALAAGARAAYAVRPADGTGPVLVGRLVSGTQQGVDEEGLLLGPLVLGPGHRWAAQWRWEVVPDARAVRFDGLPSTTWLDLGQSLALPAGPDVAVVAPGLVVEEEQDRVEVSAREPGPYAVELRAAAGTTTYALSWAPDLDAVVDAAAQVVVAGPTTPAGTLRLGTAEAALLVQDAVRRRSVGPDEELGEALDLAAARWVDELAQGTGQRPEGPGTDPLLLAFLARETGRTGDATLLEAASASLLGVEVPSRGTGLAGGALALARIGSDGSGARELARLSSLLRAAGSTDEEAALELTLLVGPRAVARGAVEGTGPVLPGLLRLGATLGAGLPGRRLPAVDLERVAYAATLLGLVDEANGQRLGRTWGTSAAELVRRTAAEARARVAELDGAAAGHRALAWLLLGHPSD